MARIVRLAGLVGGVALCVQAAAGLAGALGSGAWTAAGRMSLLVAGIAVATAAARLGPAIPQCRGRGGAGAHGSP